MKFTPYSSRLLLLLALTGCSTTSGPALYDVLPDTTGQNGRACVQARDIDGYGILDNHVISIDGGRRYYLATLMPGCNGVSTSSRALFQDRFDDVCGGGMYKLHSGGDTCAIRQLFEFENRQAAFDAYDAAKARQKELQQKSSD